VNDSVRGLNAVVVEADEEIDSEIDLYREQQMRCNGLGRCTYVA